MKHLIGIHQNNLQKFFKEKDKKTLKLLKKSFDILINKKIYEILIMLNF